MMTVLEQQIKKYLNEQGVEALQNNGKGLMGDDPKGQVVDHFNLFHPLKITEPGRFGL